jgi:hypothetical protein
MPLVTSGQNPVGFGLKTNRILCWNCNKETAAAVIDPASQRPLCQDCAGARWQGVEVVEKKKDAEKT